MITLQFAAEQIDFPAAAGCLSKAQEIAILGAVVAQLPDGYLRDILTDLKPEIERAIRTDWCAIMTDFEQQRTAAESAAAEARKTAEKLTAAAERMQSEYNRAERRIAESVALRTQLKNTIQAIRDL